MISFAGKTDSQKKMIKIDFGIKNWTEETKKGRAEVST
jgi:hypothetical protein